MRKISIRQGRFKKKLVTLSELETEAPKIEKEMTPFVEEYFAKKITDAELCGIYILLVLNHRRPHHFLGQKLSPIFSNHTMNFPISKLPLSENVLNKISHLSIGDVFNQYSLRSTPIAVNRSLLSWSINDYKLVLSFKIPPHLKF